jgi:hypothetical protein
MVGFSAFVEGRKITYYRDYQNYIKVPDESLIIIYFDDEETIIDWYDFYALHWEHDTRFHFTNGILMKREYINSRTEIYTVS